MGAFGYLTPYAPLRVTALYTFIQLYMQQLRVVLRDSIISAVAKLTSRPSDARSPTRLSYFIAGCASTRKFGYWSNTAAQLDWEQSLERTHYAIHIFDNRETPDQFTHSSCLVYIGVMLTIFILFWLQLAW